MAVTVLPMKKKKRNTGRHHEDGVGKRQADTGTKTVGDIVRENVCTYFNFIFAFLALLLCLVGAFRSLTFLPIIIVNTLIGIVQELRAKKVLDEMNMLGAVRATVERDGEAIVVPVDELRYGDLLILKAGNQICADGQVTEGEVQVNEALLTGESDDITKGPGDELISGSFVVSGECRARLIAVGEDSYISRLTREAQAMDVKQQSQMLRSLDGILKIVGVILVPIGIALFLQGYYVNHETLADSVTSMVAALIGMIPEGLYLLTSVTLVVSSMRLARRKVLLHDMKSIETLARVDVLCVDKTGTITENTMEVRDLVPAEEYGADRLPELLGLLGDFSCAMSGDNATMQALKAHFQERIGLHVKRVIPFSPVYKYSAVAFEEGSYVLGAPEFVLRDDFAKVMDTVEGYAARGYRVLVFASYSEEPDGKVLTEQATPLGFVLLSNPVRKTAAETFAYFEEQGVEIKVISGDAPRTVSEAAKEAKISGAERYVDATTLKTEREIEAAMQKYMVFGRVTPEQKRQMIRALQQQGHTVAMTGDGVNDVLALKDADCSVAMASGSDAAAQASQVVLLDSDFSCMPQVVLEGRRVVNNIQRSAGLFLVKNIFSLLLSLFSLITVYTYPLEPAQISLISMFTIGIPGFFLAMEPNKERIRGNFLKNVFAKALPAAVTDTLAVGALVVFGDTFGVASDDISTAATMLLAIVGFMILYKTVSPPSPRQWVIFIGSVAGLLLCSFYLPELFSLSGMSVKCIMLFVLFSIATEPVFRYLSLLADRLRSHSADL
ncbi:MAG: cation-translocating P-type ATPase [Lachnospiraceae bacterium]|nr:cation-translocating P-type ATPase [Lachnospiraceae bacterium]